MGFLKKIVKVVAVVAAVALAVPTGGGSLLAVGLGVSAIGATAIVAGLTVASALLNRPKAPPVSPASTQRLNTSIDPRTPRKIAFGETALATDIRDVEYTGTDDEYLHYFIVNAAHAIDGHTAIYFDDKLAWTAAGGVQGDYVGYLTVATRTEGSAGNAINISPRMGLTRRYTGLAYVHLRFKRTGNDEKANSPFSSAIPSRMTIVGRAMRLYDPRQDSTQPGGSGAHRIDNQASWTWGDHCRNPAIQLLAYLIGYRINGRLSVGKGIPAARLHIPSFMVAANECDVPIVLAAGGTQPRYRSDGLFSEADQMGAVIDAFKATMAAEIDDSDGRFAVKILTNDLDDPIAHFGPDDFLDGLTWRPITDISSRFNVVRGQYPDPRPESLYQMIDYPEVAIASVDGIERSHPFPLALVQDPSQAQRTAKQLLQRQQYSGLLEMQTGHTGWLVQKYDIVAITHPPLGFVDKLFRVAGMSVGTHGQVQFTLREENAAIYAWEAEESPPVQPAGATPYEHNNNPIVGGIEGAAAYPRHEPSSAAINFSANSDGEIDPPDQLPESLLVQRFRGSTDVSTDPGTVWSIVYTEGLTGGPITVTDGVVNIPSGIVLSPGYALIRIQSVRDGLALLTNLTLTQANAPPNTDNADSNLSGVATTTLEQVSKTMKVMTGASGQLNFSGILSIMGDKGEPTGTFGAVVRWRYREAPAGPWNWAGATIGDTEPLEVTYDAELDRYLRAPGQINTARTQSGLLASTEYEFELWAARDSAIGARTITFPGTVVGTGS